MRIRAGDDFNYVTVLNHRAQGNYPAVYARAGAGVADFRVNHIGEVNRRGAAGQLNHLPHRRERVNVLGIKIELQSIDELARVFYFLGPFNQRAQDLQCFVVVTRPALPFLIFPMRGDAFFCYSMHLLGANLHFEGQAFRSDHRGVQRLIEIIARRGNPVFEAARDRIPGVMNHPEGCITMTNLVGRNDARGHQIVNLIQIDLLHAQLFPNRIKTLDATFEADERDTCFLHFLLNGSGNVV